MHYKFIKVSRGVVGPYVTHGCYVVHIKTNGHHLVELWEFTKQWFNINI